MTTQPSFMTDLPSVNSNTVASQSSPSSGAGQQQHAPQNLSSSQASEAQSPNGSPVQSSTNNQGEIPAQVPQDAPLSLAKVLVPAQVAVVAHNFSEQQSQQQSVLFQALTGQSTPHFIALTVPSQETERHEIAIPSGQAVPCVQYVDEGGGTSVFSAPSSHMYVQIYFIIEGFISDEVHHCAVDKAVRLALLVAPEGFSNVTAEEVNTLIECHSNPLTNEEFVEMTRSLSEEEEEVADNGEDNEPEERGNFTFGKPARALQQRAQEIDENMVRAVEFSNCIDV
ncbi:uncharacterized protein LOC118205538 [Stegodyphus dumicola]|uniref:uncharacterized protein LOC118205538 n=1 Tax=Stegodyphus dumicola TaxID=202533 RepID=UPI0015B2EA44|nr:uncharacterized protein LOC118205538 [Stegodyphus dumicola]